MLALSAPRRKSSPTTQFFESGNFDISGDVTDTVRQMVATGTLIDPGMVCFNARLSERYPTIEIRIAHVCLRADDTALIAMTRGVAVRQVAAPSYLLTRGTGPVPRRGRPAPVRPDDARNG